MKRSGVTSFKDSIRLSIPIPKKPCALRNHFSGALREVVARIDYLALHDKSGERFIFSHLYNDLQKHCRDKDTQKPFHLQMIKGCLRYLREAGILSEPVTCFRFGANRVGRIVAGHAALAKQIDGYCVLELPAHQACHRGPTEVSQIAPISPSAIPTAIPSAIPNTEENERVLHPANCLTANGLTTNSTDETSKFLDANPLNPLNSKATQDTEARKTTLAPARTDSLALSPDQNERDPIDTLLTAARALTAIYGDAGTNLATYIAAHTLNGNHRWPRSVSYYVVTAQNYRPESSRGDVVKDGTQGGIYDFMLENASERLQRAADRVGEYGEEIVWELERQRERMAKAA
jgi:hypothetical protein